MFFLFRHSEAPFRGPRWGGSFIFNGALCIIFAFLIFANPALLAYIVATFFLLLGISLISVGWRMRGW